MRPTFMGMNVIGKTHDRLMVACGILHSYFNCNIIHFTICVDWFFKDDIFVFIDVFDVTRDPTFVVVMLFLLQAFSLIRQRNTQATIQKG